MAYKLKAKTESISIVDGPFAGRTFIPGRVYDEIPPQEIHRFEIVKEPADLIAEIKPAKTKAKTNEGAAFPAPPENEEVQ